jgi:spermidine synthase
VSSPEILERRRTADGELVLRRSGEQLELIMNGVFLMSTGNGESERELVRAVGARGRLLIGGLGAGYSLAAAVSEPDVSEVVVVESEADVITWNDTYFRPYNEGALDDPKVTVVHADLGDYLAARPRAVDGPAVDGPCGFDGICLDTDNGPDWLSQPGNAALYGPAGLALLRDLLTPEGRLAVWAAHESAEFAGLLGTVFTSTGIVRVPVERGPDDIIYVASRLSATLSTFPLVSLGSSAGNLKCAGILNAASRSRQ